MNWEEAAEKVFRGDTKLTEAAVILVESMNPAEVRRWAVFGAEERLTSLVRNKENVQRERVRRDQQKAVEKANLEYHQRLAQERADREAEERQIEEAGVRTLGEATR